MATQRPRCTVACPSPYVDAFHSHLTAEFAAVWGLKPRKPASAPRMQHTASLNHFPPSHLPCRHHLYGWISDGPLDAQNQLLEGTYVQGFPVNLWPHWDHHSDGTWMKMPPDVQGHGGLYWPWGQYWPCRTLAVVLPQGYNSVPEQDQTGQAELFYKY